MKRLPNPEDSVNFTSADASDYRDSSSSPVVTEVEMGRKKVHERVSSTTPALMNAM